MKVFLTSKMGNDIKVNGVRKATAICNDNGFLDKLKALWNAQAKVLVIASAPDAFEINDSIKDIFTQSFALSHLDAETVDLCDGRYLESVRALSDYDVVILAGGHVPTQNNFFHDIVLRECLKNFDGTLIGISAGTMNCADVVYAAPEAEGESIDPDYQRFIPGLGVTDLNIFPHYQKVKDEVLDGKRVMEDITYPDSIGHTFYALVDGSFIYQENETATVYGECYRIQDGVLSQICELGQQLQLY